MSTVAVSRQPRTVLADVLPRTVLNEVALVVGAAALVGLLAQVSIHLSFTPVPVTGQTLGVMLAGTALGWRRAGLSMALYMVAGVAGIPWFAGHASGYVNANFGYIVGFVVAGSLLGWVASRGGDRKISRAFFAMAVGDAVIFLIGVAWLGFADHLSAATAISYGFTPFVWGEVIKAGIAGVALPSSWRLVDRATRR